MVVASVVRQFEGQGTSRATLFRWVAAALDRDDLPAVKVKAPKTPAKPAAGAGRGVTIEAELPATTSVRIAEAGPDQGATLGAVGILESLQEAITVAKQCIAFGRKEDGTVRNSRLLLAASDNLRKALETANRIYEKVNDQRRVEAFHRRIMHEIGKVDPPARKRIMDALVEIGRDGIL